MHSSLLVVVVVAISNLGWLHFTGRWWVVGVYVVWCYICAACETYFMRKFQRIEIGRRKAFLKSSPLYLLYREMTRIKSLALKEGVGWAFMERGRLSGSARPWP